jgi:DegV family protein with EDD domain
MAFCDVTRLKVLEILRNGEKSATELQEQIGTGQSTLSHHMKILTESGMVTARKSGKWTHYSIDERDGRYAARLLRLLTTKNNAAEAETPCENIFEERKTNMTKPFTIIVDTSCDISPEYLKQHGIDVMPITFTLDGVEHSKGSWQEISEKEFYDTLRNGGMASTAQINPDAFVKSFTNFAEQGKDALYIILSSGLSATYQSSQIALAEVRETYPECNIYPVDSICATSLNALMLMMAVKKRDEGLSAAETAAFLEKAKHRIFAFFTVDDLMYLHRGGRLGKLSAIGGSLLGIKPVLTIKPDGTLKLKDKARGREAALKQLAGELKRSVNPGTKLDTVFIPHTDSEDDALALAEMVKAEVTVRKIEIVTMGPVIGAHVGPGAIAVVYEADMTREEYERKYDK